MKRKVLSLVLSVCCGLVIAGCGGGSGFSNTSALDELAAKIDNLYAQSKNKCDIKLNDIIALSQGSYSGEFEQTMNEERRKYDELISSGKYKDAYDQLIAMEEMYLAYE